MSRRNALLLASSAIGLSLDALSTQRNFAHGAHDINPVLQALQSRKGTALYFAASFSGEVALMGVAHKKGWHRMEWLVPTAITGIEGYWTAHNLRMRFYRPAPPIVPQQPVTWVLR